MEKKAILEALQKGFGQVSELSRTISPETILRDTPDGKWNIAGNLRHLILSNRALLKAFMLPAFSLRVFGKPSGPSRSYDEIVETYKKTLSSGGKATKPFIPRKPDTREPEKLISDWEASCRDLIAGVEKWEDEKLDLYLLPHPLLGKLTVREMLYFTIYHTGHHLNAIRKLI